MFKRNHDRLVGLVGSLGVSVAVWYVIVYAMIHTADMLSRIQWETLAK